MIHFVTPCYRIDPQKAADWSITVIKALGLKGATVGLEGNCPNLNVARARLLAGYYESRQPYLFLHDDDIDVQPGVVARMLALEAPGVVAPYRVRGTERYAVTYDSQGQVTWAGLGCALVRRDVIDALWDLHFEELHFFELTAAGERARVGLFDDEFADVNGVRRKLKDDHAFWLRVRLAGYPIVALDDVTTTHAGEVSHYRRPAP